MNSKTKRAIADAYRLARDHLHDARLFPEDSVLHMLRVAIVRALIRELRESEARVAFWKDGHARREAEWQKAQDRVRELEAEAEAPRAMDLTLPQCLTCSDTGKDPFYPETNVCPDCYDKGWSAARRRQ